VIVNQTRRHGLQAGTVTTCAGAIRDCITSLGASNLPRGTSCQTDTPFTSWRCCPGRLAAGPVVWCRTSLALSARVRALGCTVGCMARITSDSAPLRLQVSGRYFPRLRPISVSSYCITTVLIASTWSPTAASHRSQLPPPRGGPGSPARTYHDPSPRSTHYERVSVRCSWLQSLCKLQVQRLILVSVAGC
jgi:hypothetical protein